MEAASQPPLRAAIEPQIWWRSASRQASCRWPAAAMQAVRFTPALRERLGLERPGGLVLLSVEPDSPSALAGLLVGDVIVGLDTRPIEQLDQVLEVLAGDLVGKTVPMDLVRG